MEFGETVRRRMPFTESGQTVRRQTIRRKCRSSPRQRSDDGTNSGNLELRTLAAERNFPEAHGGAVKRIELRAFEDVCRRTVCPPLRALSRSSLCWRRSSHSGAWPGSKVPARTLSRTGRIPSVYLCTSSMYRHRSRRCTRA